MTPRHAWPVGILLICILIATLAVRVPRGAEAVKGEWRAYAGDARATKYSPLDQVNRNNFKTLRIAWRQSAVPIELRSGRTNVSVPANYEHTPLMAGGLLYMSTALGLVAALDPATGRVVWAEARETPAAAPGPPAGASRGLAYWTDGKDARVLSVS